MFQNAAVTSAASGVRTRGCFDSRRPNFREMVSSGAIQPGTLNLTVSVHVSVREISKAFSFMFFNTFLSSCVLLLCFYGEAWLT